MAEGLIRYLLEQGREASLVSYLLVTGVLFGLALHKEWIVLGKSAKRDREGCDAKAKALDAVNERLTEQRILNGTATNTIESLRERVRELELRAAKAEGQEWQQRPRERQRR